MSDASPLPATRFDWVGILLSGACALHCLATLALVTMLGLGGSVLLDPAIHRVGLGTALLLGVVAIGAGYGRHRRAQPLVLGAVGLALMALALATGHSPFEAVLTVAGVTLVALAHWRNLGHLAR